ncbi:MAG TPA: hypothetical protein VF790_07460 [Dissulfurispiraceae bacterium]
MTRPSQSPLLRAGCGLLFLMVLFHAARVFAGCRPLSLSINAPPSALGNSITKTTIDDVSGLLQQGFPGARIALNDPHARIQIILPDIRQAAAPAAPRFSNGKTYDYLRYPDHEYRWDSRRRGNRIVLHLETPSFQGAAFGLYGLLQEKLGFKFYHPKRTLVPSHRHWPLPAVFSWSAAPRFDKKGFHLHTQHPIELTEQFLNPDYPGALADLKGYIDWLARNQQNVFQFFLLRDIDRARWIGYAGEFVAYAHKRGILAGVELSLSMLQQKAFQAVKLLNPYPPYRDQIDKTLSWLFRVKWDFVTVDFTMGEYLPDVGRLMPSVRDYMIERITGEYHTKLMLTTHVIRRSQGDESSAPSTKAGVLIHTVMCYSIDEPSAPVYGNVNQKHMLQKTVEENRRRETWYWPESAYWVSFDNSIPLLLLPYLDARWSDMNTMERLGVSNHLTFSSGWEWGYWLVDWSIARWAWAYKYNGTAVKSGPLSALYDLYPEMRIRRLWQKALALQEDYLKKRRLIRFMSALDPSAELPWPFNNPFQPRPDFTYPWLLRKASDDEAARAVKVPIALLSEYAEKMNAVAAGLERETERFSSGMRNAPPDLDEISRELVRGLQVTALRARHRALTLRALMAQRKRRWWQSQTPEAVALLNKAALVRQRARALVVLQEKSYRYPVALIARRRKDFTAYHFGYLYPASNLFFWEREESQVRNSRFHAFYMSIWNFRRIVGIESLCR